MNKEPTKRNNNACIWFILLLAMLLTMIIIASNIVTRVANAATEYPLGYPSSPLHYLGLAGERCEIGNRGGYWDDYYPGDPRWFCRGEITCNGVYYSFAVQATATLNSTEARPLVHCGERGDDTLYLTFVFGQTVLGYQVYLPVVLGGN